MSADEQLCVRLVTGECEQVLWGEVAAKLLGEDLGILHAELEDHHRTDVPEHGSTRVTVVDLVEVLIGDGEIEPILAGF